MPEKDSETGRAPNFAGLAMSKLIAITGSAQGEMSGTPAPESAAKTESGEKTPSTVGLPSQQIGAIALSTGTAQAAELKAEAQRVKGYPGSAKVIASPESLTLSPGSIIGISPDSVPPSFAREYRLSNVTHTLSAGGFVSNLEFYTPQAAKKADGGINLTGEQTDVSNIPGDKLANPMPGAARGTPFDPIGTIRGRPHTGVDLADFGSKPLIAAGDGTIVDIKTGCVVGDRGCGGGYGNYVEIGLSGHWEGWKFFYAHLSRVDVRLGQKVTKGQVIGMSGNTGSSGGDHLHAELRNPGGGLVDPELHFLPLPSGTYGEGAGIPLRGGS
jgi:murein DD-endopeptidase MepM/ murein hydrolase activator NlpD